MVDYTFIWTCLTIGAIVAVISSIKNKESAEVFLFKLAFIEMCQVVFWLVENLIYYLIK